MGRRHPRFLFDHVPFIPSDNSWSAENRDPCPDTVTPPAGTKSCVLQYWHPFFVEQYVKMVHALASHLAHAEYAQKLLGVRQNFDAVGTEGLAVPAPVRNTTLWHVPPGVVAAPPFSASGTALAYTSAVFDAHIDAFVGGPVMLLARNNLDQQIRESTISKHGDLWKQGRVGWFHTSSELEPRAYGSKGLSGDWPQYETFKAGCASTVCYAEPWADAWGFHGRRDVRWCSPPQWIYWRLLSDLQMGVSNIALYGNDASVAADGTHMKEVVGARYQQEFEAAFEFAARYVGHWGDASTSPGAWIAFRESATVLGDYNNKTTDYEFHMSLLNKEEATVGLDARTDGQPVPVVPNRTRANQSSIGPPDSRFGAWARRLKPGVAAQLGLAEGAALRARGGAVTASVVYLDSNSGATLRLCGAGECSTAAVGDSGEWKVLRVPGLRLAAGGAQLSLTAMGGPVVVHMVELALK